MLIDARQPAANSHRRRVWRRFRSSRRGVIGLAVVVMLLSVALLAPLIAGDRPIACRYEGALHFPALIDVAHRFPFGKWLVRDSLPFSNVGFDAKRALDNDAFALWPPIPYGPLEISEDALASPSRRHWLGTDGNGRDLAARMVHGAVVSVKVGFISMGIAAIVGVLIGSTAGYFGGWTDAILSRLVEVVVCFPSFFLILAVMVWLEPGIGNVMVVIGLTRWTSIARFTRGEFMRLKRLDFVVAARAMGAGPIRIMFRQLLPNALAPVLVTITFGVAQAILLEAGLSWLGFGVQPPEPSWGNVLRSAYTNLRVAPHMVYPPCVAIFVAVLVYNLVGDALRDAIDPRVRGRS